MRDLKFRVVWNGQVSTESFTIGEFWDRLVELEFKDGETLPFGDIDWENDKVEYQQFCGLTDKNGKEIYEGDILAKPGVSVNGKPYRKLVEWDNDGYVPDSHPEGWESTYFSGFEFDEDPKDLEIIGNKWENPELLK